MDFVRALNRPIRRRVIWTVAVYLGMCAAAVLGLITWKVAVTTLLAIAAVPFIVRALLEVPAKTNLTSSNEDDKRARPHWFWAVVVMVAGTQVMVIRNPDAFLNPQFWQEDLFLFQDARQDGLRSLVTMLDRPQIRRGQTVLTQRLIAYLGQALPPRKVPLFYVAASLSTTLTVAAYVLYARIDGLSLLARMLMALSILMAYSAEHIYLTLINLQWILALLLLLILMEKDPKTRWGRLALFGGLGFLSLTGPFITFLWIIVLLRALRRRTASSTALLAIALPCAIWQLMQVQILFTPGKVNLSDPYWQVFLGRSYVGRLFLGPFAETGAIPRLLFLATCAIVYASLAVYVWRRGDVDAAVPLLASLLFLASAAITFRIVPEAIAKAGHRYYFVPYVCLTWLLIIAAVRARRIHWRALAGVAFAATVLASVADFTARPLPDMNWQESCRAIDGPEPCIVYTNPFPQFFSYFAPDHLPKNYRLHTLPDPLPPRWH